MRSAAPSVIPSAQNQLLFVGRSLDFQLTTDQPLSKVFQGTSYIITKVLATRKTGGATVACVGGLYTAASKAGNALVAATQSWIGLSGAGKVADATLAGIVSTDAQTASLILSLTTGSTAAITGDVLVFGVIVD